MAYVWKKRLGRVWREWCRPIIAVVIVLCTFRSAVADWHDVPTGSMKPTVLEGDRIVVNKLAYDLRVPFTGWRLVSWGDPAPGDVVILFSPDSGERLVKRVVAGPGDTVELIRNQLVINGRPLAYGPLDQDTVEQIDAAQRGRHQFAAERVGKHDHPVMSTPASPAPRTFGPTVVPADEYFVMGDNRDGSRDSRFFGTVRRNAIVGRVFGIAFSLNGEHYYLPRLDRFFRAVP
ncbi:MAG: signal peptidase I [Phycisphaerales bacterium]|nr:signal peptidase I [Phycisphaerales bacterium]